MAISLRSVFSSSIGIIYFVVVCRRHRWFGEPDRQRLAAADAAVAVADGG